MVYSPFAMWGWRGMSWPLTGTEDEQCLKIRALIKYLLKSLWNHLPSPKGDSGTKSTQDEESKGVDSNPVTGANLEILTSNETLTSSKVNRWPPSEDMAQLSLKTGPQTASKEGGSPTWAPWGDRMGHIEMRGRLGKFENERWFVEINS